MFVHQVQQRLIGLKAAQVIEEALDRWSAYFSELGVHRIVEGV